MEFVREGFLEKGVLGGERCFGLGIWWLGDSEESRRWGCVEFCGLC